MQAEANRARPAQVDEVVALDVVHFHVAVEAARELRRDEACELVVARAARQTARDEQRLVAALDPESLELLDRRSDRLLPRIPFRPRKRQSRGLDEDGRPAAVARDERLERLAGEWEPERVPHGGANVRNSDGRRRRAERERVVCGSHDDEPRPGEHRDPCHGIER